MMYLIAQGQGFDEDMNAMHRLRRQVFKDRLAWEVNIEGDMEVDQFDRCDPTYLIHRNNAGRVNGCIRLLPSQGPNMLRDVFSELLDGPVPCNSRIWESSRFCLDTSGENEIASGGLSQGTYELFLGLIEFGLYRGLTHIMTVTDVRVERILKRAHWPLERLGAPQRLGNTIAVAGLVEISNRALTNMRSMVGTHQPLLWLPAQTARAA